jgi:hypothetical protein
MKSLKLPLVLAVCAGGVLATAGSASAWAPASSATIHPGIMTFSGAPSFLGGAAQCTANFLFTDASGNVYLGQAAHCTETGAQTNPCAPDSLPPGTPIYAGDLVNGGLQSGTRIGTLAYNSWIAMNNAGERDANTCAFNDLALIRLDSGQANANPTVPIWGGPNGLAPGAAGAGTVVYSYGNSILRGGVSPLSPKVGVSLGDIEGTGGWSEDVYTLTPGIPGDSGSAFLDASGNALGVLSTIEEYPLTASNGVGTLADELAYANAKTGAGYAVASGTSPFTGTPSLTTAPATVSNAQPLVTANRQIARAHTLAKKLRRHSARHHARARR